jgi:hypothetical protein
MWVCSDCGFVNQASGDCTACGKGPLLDAARPEVRDMLLDDDVKRRNDHKQRLLWLTVVVMVSVYFGGCMMGSVKVAAQLASIPGIISLIAVSFGMWFLLQKVFPAKSRFDYLKR